MKTPVERLIEAVENGYNSNDVLWKEWKNTILEAEKDLIKEAFLCGDNSEFHLNVPNINSGNDFMVWYLSRP
jgi:hypothetical protein